MKTIKQMFRQPLKSLTGLILITFAAAIVCLCVGQALATRATEADLNYRFSTVAIPQPEESLQLVQSNAAVTVSAELLTWLETTAQNHPDIIQSIVHHGFLSAYIPQMTPLNITSEQYVAPLNTSVLQSYFYQSSPYAMPYSCAMLVIQLEEVSTPTGETMLVAKKETLTADDFTSVEDYNKWLNTVETETVIQGYTVELTGTVAQVISLQEGYRDPQQRVARLSLTVPTLEALDQLDLIPGQQYIVHGTDYVDEHWKFVGSMNQSGQYSHLQFDPFDPALLHVFTEEELERNRQKAQARPELAFLADAVATYNYVFLKQYTYNMVNAISMSLDGPISLIEYQVIRDEETGTLLQLQPQNDITYTDAGGQTVTVSLDEYIRRYQQPTIARLDGTVEAFLQSEAGQPWRAALQRDAINNQSFAVIGVEKMGYLADFSMEKSKIAAGRDFTAEELASGARVCIISESLATANGLRIGDTITPSFYQTDGGLPGQYKGALNPTASFYFDTTPFTETAEYTIVGLWRGQGTFADVSEDEYAFSPNTIFIPKSSVQTTMESCDGVPFITVVLNNGKIDQFRELAGQAGHAGMFKYNDQGYSTVAGNFHNYKLLANQILLIGMVMYLLLLLFLLLYPCTQRKNVKTMLSLGAPFRKLFAHVLASSMALVIPGSLLGGLLGHLLWSNVSGALQASAESSISMQLDPLTLAVVALMQLVVAFALSAIVALFVALPKGMSSRR